MTKNADNVDTVEATNAASGVNPSDVPSGVNKYEAALRAIVEMVTKGIPVSITDGPVTFGWGEDGNHIHLGRYNSDPDHTFSVPLTAESLANTILEVSAKSVSPWREMTEADVEEMGKQCWKQNPNGQTWCGLDKNHEGKCSWERPCGAILYIGDDYGDNSTTMRCQLMEGHVPPCKEVYDKDRDGASQHVEVTWTADERETCEKCSVRAEHEDTTFCYDCERKLCLPCYGVQSSEDISHCEKCYSVICGNCQPSHACLPCGCHKHRTHEEHDTPGAAYVAECYRLGLVGQGMTREEALASLSSVVAVYMASSAPK